MTQLQLNIGARSERGQRQFNNDAVAFWPAEPLLLTTHCCAAIADGVGATRQGGDAARLACTTALHHAAREGLQVSPRTVLQQAFALSHQQVKNLQAEACSTLTVLMTRGDQLWLAHAGDSRLYRWRDGKLKCLTVDHRSVSAEMGGGLLRAVGLGSAITADISRHTVRRHDRYALLSDGVYETLSVQQLNSVLSQTDDAQSIAARLVDESLKLGSQDNASALLMDIIDINQQLSQDVLATLNTLPLASIPAVGAVHDDYRIESLLAKTRLHQVFRAIDQRTNESVVLKFSRCDGQEEAQARANLLHEMAMGLKLRHPQLVLAKSPNLARQKSIYVVYPFVAGQTLPSHDIKRYGLRQLLRIGIELAELLEFLHQQNIVHADLKPDNILRGNDGKLYLIDFSVAHTIDSLVTQAPLGTPNFMAPELWQSDSSQSDLRQSDLWRQRAPTAASDQFALASTLYQLASGGEPPFGDIEMFSKPAFKSYRRLREWRDDLPLWFDVLLERALQRDASARFADCRALADALREGLQHGVGLAQNARQPSWLERDPLKFYQTLSALLAVLCLLLFLHLLH